jgi:hypothetical protein
MDDKEIRIDGLTPEQVRMLNDMWSLGSSEEFELWYESLDDDEVQMADQLKEMLVYAVMDAMLEKEKEEMADVKKYLKKFMLNK